MDPYALPSNWETRDAVKRLAGKAVQITAAATTEGIRFGYHNHAFEFIALEPSAALVKPFSHQVRVDLRRQGRTAVTEPLLHFK